MANSAHLTATFQTSDTVGPLGSMRRHSRLGISELIGRNHRFGRLLVEMLNMGLAEMSTQHYALFEPAHDI